MINVFCSATVILAMGFADLHTSAGAQDSNSSVVVLGDVEKPLLRNPINCDSTQSIRDFKDLIMGTMAGTDSTGQKDANKWTDCLCEKKGSKAGFNDPLPKNPESVPAMPGCPSDIKKCAQIVAVQYFKPNLPVTGEQALMLGRCSVGLPPREPKVSKQQPPMKKLVPVKL